MLTTVGDVVRRRVRDGALPDPQTVPADVREVQDELAEIRQARPTRAGRRRPRSCARPRRARRQRGRVDGAGHLDDLGGDDVGQEALRPVSARPRHRAAGRSLAAVLGWDFIYYWNHRLSHESRWLWAVHSVHHSSERYNLSTALRQPVAEGVTLTVPYGLLALAGVRPALIEQARGINLIYQFWIHTEAIQRLGWVEKVFNTPSHHRVHHGSNRDYLDRNHGSILILWDRLFGTFEEEDEPVVYGLTANIDTFNPVRIATHEWRDIAADVAAAEDLARPLVLVPPAPAGLGVRPPGSGRRRLIGAEGSGQRPRLDA